MSTYKEATAPTTKPLKTYKFDTVTPHRLSVAILINNFHELRESEEYKNYNPILASGYLKNFCLLLVKILYLPDLSLGELWSFITSPDCELPEALKLSFKRDLSEVCENGIGALMDILDDLNKIMSGKENEMTSVRSQFIGRTSVVGYYLRRLIVNFNKLLFSEVNEIYKSFVTYCKNLESLDYFHTIQKDELCVVNLWTRNQAELFIATQAALIESNEEKAMEPRELQSALSSIIKTNPSLAEAHFLSYLNYLRVKEFCGAINCLYRCFDSYNVIETNVITEDKPKACRYAALNLAVLFYHFQHHEEALLSLKEAIRIAQDANDTICLQHALSWLYRLIVTNKDKLMEHSVLRSFGLSLSYRTSLGIQTFVQLSNLLLAKPSHIFETLSKSDIVNYQHNHRDLISNSYAVKSSLWQFYGKPEMSSLWSQLLMYLNIDNPKPTKSFYGEPFCLSICNIGMHLLAQGHYNQVYAILNFAKRRFPYEPNCHIWMLCDGISYFIRALYHEDWDIAETAAQRIMIVDKWECYLRLAELYLYKQDFSEATRYLDLIFQRYKGEDEFKFKGYHYVRAKLILADIQFSSTVPHSVPSGIMDLLSNCLIDTNRYQLDYYTAMIYFRMANIQFHLSMFGQSLDVLDKCMVQIMAHGGCYDRARCLLLHAKCLVANSKTENHETRVDVIKQAIDILSESKELFRRVEAYSRMKVVLILQAKLYNEIDMKSERNMCALEVRLLDEEYVTKNIYTPIHYL